MFAWGAHHTAEQKEYRAVSPEKSLDCVLCGSCVVDMLVRPVPLETPIGGGKLVQVEPIEVTTGGIVSNAGIALARLGMRVAAFSLVGDDEWAAVIRARYEEFGIDTQRLTTLPGGATSTTAVLIDPSGERSFAHCVGAPKQMTKSHFLENLDLFARSRMTLIGYYSLMPNLESDLVEVLAAIREAGCQTALDAAGDGGSMQPLADLLPHLDVYVPSLAEAIHQTGQQEPEAIIDSFRACGAPGLLGVKLGSEGAMLSRRPGEYLKIEQVPAPGPVVDTTGAGDCFYAGLLAGLLRQESDVNCGRLAAATGACCVTGLGASAGLRDYADTARLAGLAPDN
jgi:sugar/nucleoside kinase (ribokinase family)